MFDLEKLVESYDGDIHWLGELERQIVHSKPMIEREQEALAVIDILYRMNYVVVETETNKHCEKYYDEIHEIYAQMKYDLTVMLGITEFWELI